MYAVVRLRGRVGVRKEIEETMRLLRLNRVNHCVVVPKTPQYEGMLRRVKDHVTYGEIRKETLIKLLKERGRLVGNKPLDLEALRRITGFKTYDEFASALLKGRVKLKDYPEIKPIFRLNSPRKGLRSKKMHYPKGDLGYRGEAINELIERMV